MGTITNLQIVLSTQKNPYSNQATPQKIITKIFQPPKSLDHSCHLKSGVTPLGTQTACESMKIKEKGFVGPNPPACFCA